MKWRDGMMMSSGEGPNCSAIVQNMVSGLFVEVHFKDGSRRTNTTISDWNEAKTWANRVELGLVE